MKHLLCTITLLFVFLASSAQDNVRYASSTFCFPVSDLSSSIDWYNSLLGEVESFTPAEGVVEFQLNTTTWLQLFEGPLSNGAVLRLEVNKIQEEHRRLQALGISPTPVELVPGVVSYFDFKDPDGNLLSFYRLETP